MTTRTTIVITCDDPLHDGRPAVTRTLTVDGGHYETDLCAACSMRLDGVLAPVLENARRRPHPRRGHLNTTGKRTR